MDVIHRATRLMAWLSLLLVPAVAWSCGLRAAIGVASGMGWAVANVWALAWVIQGTLTDPRPSRWQQALRWLVKVPLLYAVGALLLVSPWSSSLGFLTGFSLWFVVLCLSALQRAAA